MVPSFLAVASSRHPNLQRSLVFAEALLASASIARCLAAVCVPGSTCEDTGVSDVGIPRVHGNPAVAEIETQRLKLLPPELGGLMMMDLWFRWVQFVLGIFLG